MQFVNIVVHSVEDMNFRVHLQYEFTKLGLDDYLEKLRHTESEELQVHNLLYENKFIMILLYEISLPGVTLQVVLIISTPFLLSHVCSPQLSLIFILTPKITCLHKPSF